MEPLSRVDSAVTKSWWEKKKSIQNKKQLDQFIKTSQQYKKTNTESTSNLMEPLWVVSNALKR